MRIRSFVLGLGVAALSGCGGGGSSATSPGGSSGGGGTTIGTPPANTVFALPANQFNPTTLNVSANTSVTFTFFTTTHNVTFDLVTGRPVDIANSNGTSVARTFATQGTFTYNCTLHPGMSGSVVVGP